MSREIAGLAGSVRFVEFAPAPAAAPASAQAPSGEAPQVELLPATAFSPEATRWLWPQWLASGKFHLLAGAPGTGKTTIALTLAAALSNGTSWPDDAPNEPGDVLIWSGEDGIEDTLLPRLLAAGGAPARVHFVIGARAHGRVRPFDPASDMQALADAACGLDKLRLVILDPVVSVVTGDSHKNTETRRGLQPIVDLAMRLDCAVLGITHLSKNSGGREPLDRVTGSIAFGALARVVLVTVKPADHAAPRRLVRAKSNLGPDSGGFEYRLFGAPVPGRDFHAQRVDWGQALTGSARELMAVELPDEKGAAQRKAQAFLQEMLRDGPVTARDLRAAAQAHGHRWRSLERAKEVIGVRAVKGGRGAGGAWAWQLPAPVVAGGDQDPETPRPAPLDAGGPKASPCSSPRSAPAAPRPRRGCGRTRAGRGADAAGPSSGRARR